MANIDPDKFRALREAAGLSQKELSKKAPAGLTTIARIEQGVATRGPNISTLHKIAHALGMSYEEFFVAVSKRSAVRAKIDSYLDRFSEDEMAEALTLISRLAGLAGHEEMPDAAAGWDVTDDALREAEPPSQSGKRRKND